MSFTFVPKPSQISGRERRMSNGLKKILKNGFSSMALRLSGDHGVGQNTAARRTRPECRVLRAAYDVVRLGLEDGQLRRVEGQPLLRELPDRAVGEQLLDRFVHEGTEGIVLLERRAVLLVRDDLSDDRAVRLRLEEPLGAEDRRVVERRVATLRLELLVHDRRRLRVQRLLRGLDPILDERGARGADLRAE